MRTRTKEIPSPICPCTCKRELGSNLKIGTRPDILCQRISRAGSLSDRDVRAQCASVLSLPLAGRWVRTLRMTSSMNQILCVVSDISSHCEHLF